MEERTSFSRKSKIKQFIIGEGAHKRSPRQEGGGQHRVKGRCPARQTALYLAAPELFGSTAGLSAISLATSRIFPHTVFIEGIHELHARVHAAFAVNAMDVGTNGGLGDEQLLRGETRGSPRQQIGDHLALATRKPASFGETPHQLFPRGPRNARFRQCPIIGQCGKRRQFAFGKHQGNRDKGHEQPQSRQLEGNGRRPEEGCRS